MASHSRIHRPENSILSSNVSRLHPATTLIQRTAVRVCHWLNNSWRECFYCPNSHFLPHCEGNCSPIKPFQHSIISGEKGKLIVANIVKPIPSNRVVRDHDAILSCGWCLLFRNVSETSSIRLIRMIIAVVTSKLESHNTIRNVRCVVAFLVK